MAVRVLLVFLFAALARGCVVYEYEHEVWVKVNGSGTVNVTGRPELWAAFKNVPFSADMEEDALRAQARGLFERSGLTVKRVTVTHRGGRPYLFVSADFSDVNALAGTAAFPDLRLGLRPEGDKLRLTAGWVRPTGAAARAPGQTDGVMAVRFHLPSKVYGHGNAMDGVERGNIVGWRQEVTQALAGGTLEMWALIDQRSILRSTVALFGIAIVLALAIMSAALYWFFRKGRTASASQ